MRDSGMDVRCGWGQGRGRRMGNGTWEVGWDGDEDEDAECGHYGEWHCDGDACETGMGNGTRMRGTGWDGDEDVGCGQGMEMGTGVWGTGWG